MYYFWKNGFVAVAAVTPRFLEGYQGWREGAATDIRQSLAITFEPENARFTRNGDRGDHNNRSFRKILQGELFSPEARSKRPLELVAMVAKRSGERVMARRAYISERLRDASSDAG